jgi:hypothetical protein
LTANRSTQSFNIVFAIEYYDFYDVRRSEVEEDLSSSVVYVTPVAENT